MKDIMLADTPVEQRAQILRDSCDEVVEKSYLSKFSQEETNELRANLVEVQIQMQELTENFDVVKADFKGKMKPLQERIGKMLDDLRKGGEYIKGECYKFIDQDEGRVGYYTPDGYLLEGILHLLPRRPQRFGGYGSSDGRLGVPDPPPGGRFP